MRRSKIFGKSKRIEIGKDAYIEDVSDDEEGSENRTELLTAELLTADELFDVLQNISSCTQQKAEKEALIKTIFEENPHTEQFNQIHTFISDVSNGTPIFSAIPTDKDGHVLEGFFKEFENSNGEDSTIAEELSIRIIEDPINNTKIDDSFFMFFPGMG